MKRYKPMLFLLVLMVLLATVACRVDVEEFTATVTDIRSTGIGRMVEVTFDDGHVIIVDGGGPILQIGHEYHIRVYQKDGMGKNWYGVDAEEIRRAEG